MCVHLYLRRMIVVTIAFVKYVSQLLEKLPCALRIVCRVIGLPTIFGPLHLTGLDPRPPREKVHGALHSDIICVEYVYLYIKIYICIYK